MKLKNGEENLVEAVAEVDDDLLERFLEDHEFNYRRGIACSYPQSHY
ncbi:MAG: hypothetical protein MZV63_39555 [Marinilabiliales bacterium]|nr:hypothetical protein [Marinilabiliales bacterium]